jgi:hypothetical protein
MGSTGDEATDGPTGVMDEDAWFDVDMGGPLDTEVQLSGEGGETEHLSEYLGRYVDPVCIPLPINLVLFSMCNYNGSQLWSLRLHLQQERWDEQLPSLIDAYLHFKSHEFDNSHSHSPTRGDDLEH